MLLVDKTKQLEKVAQEINCTVAQLAIAWCLKNPNVSSVITGATHLTQLQENIGALDIKEKLNTELLEKINAIVDVPAYA